MRSIDEITNKIFFFFNDTATTEIYTLSLHDALPISPFYSSEQYHIVSSYHEYLLLKFSSNQQFLYRKILFSLSFVGILDRKSTRLNSSHANISYAVFCLKKKKEYLAIPILLHLTPSP